MTKLLEHKHIIIRAEANNPPKDETFAINSLADLIKRIVETFRVLCKYVEAEATELTVATDGLKITTLMGRNPKSIIQQCVHLAAFDPTRCLNLQQLI